eukprot:2501938-Rhodomonas_salina.2
MGHGGLSSGYAAASAVRQACQVRCDFNVETKHHSTVRQLQVRCLHATSKSHHDVHTDFPLHGQQYWTPNAGTEHGPRIIAELT